MDNNFILCTIEDAWKEFERGGEISNSADNLLSVVTELMERDKRCKADYEGFIKVLMYNEHAISKVIEEVDCSVLMDLDPHLRKATVNNLAMIKSLKEEWSNG
ncbi:hypothetical protein VP249E411_P0026 [Vibrio phage 249E41-1]|nr:hypothetical protein VP249E411_P0026 [Vibrio phage 249E41-1]CAH9012136.1 hypothetical protein VP495E541_P0030 [Vibrio phage 495E54-1]CAH9012218.1 hypothetical protein VP496E541_P0030 [Vibrio phage 496E54-1]